MTYIPRADYTGHDSADWITGKKKLDAQHRNAEAFLRTGFVADDFYVEGVQKKEKQTCSDSEACPSGWSCVEGFCVEPRGLIGGGSGYQNLGPGQCLNEDGRPGEDSCGPSRVSNTQTCSKPGCGENLNRKSASQDECCSEERCCRTSTTGVSGFNAVKCFCGPCPKVVDKKCNMWCDSYYKSHGYVGDAFTQSCQPHSYCDECTECTFGRCDRYSFTPCHCGRCPKCHVCDGGTCFKDLRTCGSKKDDEQAKENAATAVGCDGTLASQATQSTSCVSPQQQLGVITVSGQTLYICGERDFTQVSDSCCRLQCSCDSQCPSGTCLNGKCKPVADPDADPVTADSRSGGFILDLQTQKKVIIQALELQDQSKHAETTQEINGGGIIMTQNGGSVVLSALDTSRSDAIKNLAEYSSGVIISGDEKIKLSELSGKDPSDPTPNWSQASSGIIINLDSQERVVFTPTLLDRTKTTAVRSTVQIQAAGSALIDVGITPE